MNYRSILIVLVIGFVLCQNVYLQTIDEKKNSLSFQGEKAIAHLKQTEQYESLRNAFEKSTEHKFNLGNPTPILNETQEFSAANLAVNSKFGNSVAISGNTAVIGATLDAGKGAVYIFEKIGNAWTQKRKISLNDTEQFGSSVDIDGDLIIIGADQEETSEDSRGAAYIYARNTSGNWTQQARLLPSHLADSIAFGRSVTIRENYAFVGAIGADFQGDNSGAVYVFRWSGTSWGESQRLEADDGTAGDIFGADLSVFQDNLVIGAVADDQQGNLSGSAYVFNRSGSSWVQAAKLLASDGQSGDFFGGAVAVNQDTIAIGAYGESDNQSGEGAAYIFVKVGNAWREQAKIVAPDREAVDLFGASVAVQGDSVLIGSQYDDDSALNSGSAYLFTRDNGIWSFDQKIKAEDGQTEDRFSFDVAMDNGRYIIGALDNDDHGKDSGSAYVFVDSGAIVDQEELLLPNELDFHDKFGRSVAIDGNVALIGAPEDDLNGINSGAVYIFVNDGTKWVAVRKIAGNSDDGDGFGSSVAVDSNFIAIGSPDGRINSTAPNTGFVQLYQINPNGCLNNSVCLQGSRIIKGSDSQGGDDFGASVSLDGDTLIVGDPKHNVVGANSGAAYIFTRDGFNWNEQAKLISSFASFGDFFGISVAISGDRAIVGAPFSDGNEISSGTALVFSRSGTVWTQQTILTSTDNTENDEFGRSVAIEGSTAVVGAYRNLIPNTTIIGTAYVYTENNGTWGNEIKLLPENEVGFDQFGFEVDIDNNRILVGTPLGIGNTENAGNAILFKKSGASWTITHQIYAENGNDVDRFGSSIAISDNSILVGAPFTELGNFTGDLSNKSNIENIGTSDNGAAYFFQVPFNPNSTKFDFDGDSKADISIFRPGPGQWWVLKSSDGDNFALQFGASTDKIIPADYTGDGKTDIAFFRPSTSEWFILRSEDASFYSFQFGANGDIPAPGDFDGDGKADVAVYRPSTATWFINRSSDGNTDIISFGITKDKPVVADYDGDGKDDIAIFRPSNSQWWINRSTDGVVVYQFGQAGDKTVQGDYTGDGKADVAFWRPATGEWFVIRSENDSFYSFPFGANGDIPSPADYDGDGAFDATVFRPSNTTWYINGSTSGTQIIGFGLSNDTPLANAYSVP